MADPAWRILSVVLVLLTALIGFALHLVDARISRLESGEAIVMAPETRRALAAIERELDYLSQRMDRQEQRP